MEWGALEVHGQTLSPLTPGLRRGLAAIAVLASVSFAASTTLFLYLTLRLILGRLTQPPEEPRAIESLPRSSHDTTEFTLGIEGIFTEGATESAFTRNKRRKAFSRLFTGPPPNQFLVLIYNLLLADMHQSLAFLLNAAWLNQDSITVSTPTCFAQGLLLSTGDLSSSIFITTIAVHTYLSVVRKRKPAQYLLYTVILCNWVFVYAISLLPIAATRNGADRGGFFVRAGAWVGSIPVPIEPFR
ncbi:hypothetical protein HIM_05096 [Hirsutella minnesotensis 3608]|uniref:Uncharacterized protein n=1 Tax=Hirsutella minnesotensis 3608 TaxID=1043627 RepID=A0A0F7ZUX7_9HYPO|nr:hypothetical protein HIM_05096 [Hirsutella minnesotensis 3608]